MATTDSSPAPIVHIGYHKTASTWFQKQLYPHASSHRYVPREHVRSVLTRPHAFSFDPSAVIRTLVSSDSRPFVLCDEDLSGHFESGGHMGALSKEFAERIYSAFPRARIVIVIRNQLDIIAAAYAQYIKQGGTHKPEHFLYPSLYRKGNAA